MAALLVGLAVLLATPGALAADEEQDVEATFQTTEDLVVTRTVTLENRDAAELRELIDEKHGDDDSEVQAWEVDEYTDRFEERRIGQESRDHILEGKRGRLTNVDLSTTGVTGDAEFESRDSGDDATGGSDNEEFDETDFAESGDQLTLTIRETLAFDTATVGFERTLSYHFTNTTDDGSLDFQAPPGFTITSVTGLSATTFAGDQQRQVTGDTSEGQAVQIRFRLATETNTFPSVKDFLGPNAKFPSTSTTLDFQETLRTAAFTTSYELSGFDVIGLKGLIDQLGDSDGTVQDGEVARVVNDVEDETTGTASEIVFVDGDPGRLTSFGVSVQGLTGEVNTQTRVTVEQQGVLSFRVDQDEDRAVEREPGLSAEERTEEREEEDEFVEPFAITVGKTRSNSQLSVTLPDGYEFREDATRGLESAVVSSDYSNIQGTETTGQAVVLFAERLDPGKDEIAYGVEDEQLVAAGFGLAGGLGLVGLVGLGFGYAGTSRLGTLIDRSGGDDDAPGAGSAASSSASEAPGDGGQDPRGREREVAEGPHAHPHEHPNEDDGGPEVTFPEQGSGS